MGRVSIERYTLTGPADRKDWAVATWQTRYYPRITCSHSSGLHDGCTDEKCSVLQDPIVESAAGRPQAAITTVRERWEASSTAAAALGLAVQYYNQTSFWLTRRASCKTSAFEIQ